MRAAIAHAIAQVEELGATDVTVTDDLELGDLGRVKRERALHADAKGDLADGEGLTRRATAHADDVTLEHLDALAVTLLDAVVHLDVVARMTVGMSSRSADAQDGANVVHAAILVSLPRGPV